MPDIALCRTHTNSIKYMHLISNSKFELEYQVHDTFEIHFVISGAIDFFVDRNIYIVEHGDVLIINNHEIHRPLLKSNSDYERIIVEFDPTILSPFCLSDYNLLSCFVQRPNGKHNRISLNEDQIKKLKRLFENYEMLGNSQQEGADILKLTYLVELLVFVNNAFSAGSKSGKCMKVPKKIIPILDYIDSHMEENLSLASIAACFYIDKFYLSRLFLKVTGIKIHDYILSRRIFKAKELLRDGSNIMDACQLSGFENYSTFIRAFKSLVGLLPKEYQKASIQN